MKEIFEKNKYRIVNGLVVCGYTDSHIIGATKVKGKFTWTKLDKGSFVLPTHQCENTQYEYINEELLR